MRQRTARDDMLLLQRDGLVWHTVQRYIRNAVLDERKRCAMLVRRERLGKDRAEHNLLTHIEEMILSGVGIGEDR